MPIARHKAARHRPAALARAALVLMLAWPMAAPLHAEQAATGATIPQPPIQSLADGVDAALTKATDRLKTRRSEAAPALDAAMRASEVASRGAPAAFQEVHELVRQARSSLQKGDEEAARVALGQATEKARVAEVQVPEATEPPKGLRRYVGAALIDRFGRHIGEVVAAEEREGRPMLRVVLGTRDAAGAIDPEGRLYWVEADDLVFGKVKTIGNTLVAWPAAPAA